MIYVGNCIDKIPLKVIELIKKSSGDVRPSDNDVFSNDKSYIMDALKEVNYNLKGARWEMYYEEHLDFDASEIFKGIEKWWFVKLNPGDIFPYHVDFYDRGKNLKRYWIACEDYVAGHLFFSGKETLTKYSAGDIFEFDALSEWHGACNLSLKPKITLQVIALGVKNETD
jgi:hypothetical protein